MKKTYFKITILICTLILVVMVLGCALFTYFQVDRINSQYIEDIYKAAKSSPAEFEEGSTAPLINTSRSSGLLWEAPAAI